jgi:hypothetical protein
VEKRYEKFKFYDRRTGLEIEASCNEELLSNSSEDTPNFLTPIFFRPEVLQLFKSDPDKFEITQRTISCRNCWHLKTYDINEAGQVHTYLGYLGYLPDDMQFYWKAFNELPNATVSTRTIITDDYGIPDNCHNPLRSLKNKIAFLDDNPPEWWEKRPTYVDNYLQYPVANSVKEWSDAINMLDQLIVEGFKVAGLRNLLKTAGIAFDDVQASLKLLNLVLISKGITEDDAKTILCPLKKLRHLRSKVAAHATNSRIKLSEQARNDFQNLSNHFNELCAECDKAF